MTAKLASWNDGTARQAVVEFAERTVSAGVPPEERVAVFDNDGTLWCEKPMPIQADFILRRNHIPVHQRRPRWHDHAQGRGRLSR